MDTPAEPSRAEPSRNCICCKKLLPARTCQQHERNMIKRKRHLKRKRSALSLSDDEEEELPQKSAGPSVPASPPSDGEVQHHNLGEEPLPSLLDFEIPAAPLEQMQLGAGTQSAEYEASMDFEEEDVRRWESFEDEREGFATREPGDWGVDDDQFDGESDSEEAPEDWRQRWEEEWLAEDHRSRGQLELSEDDLENLSMYQIRLQGHLSRKVYRRIRRAFRRKMSHLRTEYRLQRLVDDLSELEVEIYHCCVNSCCLFVDKYADKIKCPFCSEERYQNNSTRPRQTFLYIPLIPRLIALFASPRIIEQLQYRHSFRQKVHRNGSILDIFDCQHYQDLCQKPVTVNGQELGHNYFSNPNDIALGLAGDGIQVFKKVRRGNATVTPLIIINYNLDPSIRNRLSNVFCLGVIPGPHGPKDTNSWLWPFKQECNKLASGVRAFHGVEKDWFELHAYNIMGLGDVPWITKVMCIKGHNGFCPCRECDITGVRNPDRHGPYYVPISPPIDDPRPEPPGKQWDPWNLPLRPDSGPESWDNRIASILACRTGREKDRRAMELGINSKSTMSQIPGISMSRSFPYEGMHLFFENLVPNLIDHWKGKFKSLATDSGSEDYVIPLDVWEVIGKETEAATQTIPSAFVGKLPDIHTSQYLYKAEYYSFWFTYLAPILLRGRFSHVKYYQHACDMSKIIKKCLSIEITLTEVQQLKQEMIEWVTKYEEYYYQRKIDRLEACPLTIHGLLHVPDDIVQSAPVWAAWTFVMERYAGNLITAVKSRRNPNGVLALRAKRVAQLDNIKNKFDLHQALDLDRDPEEFDPADPEAVSSKEKTYPEYYPLSVLRYPRKLEFKPDSALRHKICVHFKTRFEVRDSDWPTLHDVDQRLPETLPKWCKVRVKHGGDAIRGSDAMANPDTSRDSSFVRFSELVDLNERFPNRPVTLVRRIRYGELHSILICNLPISNLLRLKSTSQRNFLLAHISPVDTSVQRAGEVIWPDATGEPVSYTELRPLTSIVIDLSAVECVVGRIKYDLEGRERWGIIDRSGEGARTTFGEDDAWDEDDESI